TIVGARTAAVICASVLVGGCGSADPPGSASDTNQAGDPMWGQGFSTRSSDGGDPDAPSSVTQACALFGGEPWDYASIDDVNVRLSSRRWLGCADNSKDAIDAGGFWPAGFTGIVFGGDGTWQALVRAPDGSIAPATTGNTTGTYEVAPYMDTPQYA